MAEQGLVEIALERLRAHPQNANVMREALLRKLAGHIEASGQYPPVIVREVGAGVEGRSIYQILDGHHRVEALRRIGASKAWCVVWAVDDEQALVLLATLNRLEGADEAGKRAALLGKLRERMSLKELAGKLPEAGAKLEKMLLAAGPAARLRLPRPVEAIPEAVHFFLLRGQRRHLEAVLRALGGSREQALMALVAAEEERRRGAEVSPQGKADGRGEE